MQELSGHKLRLWLCMSGWFVGDICRLVQLLLYSWGCTRGVCQAVTCSGEGVTRLVSALLSRKRWFSSGSDLLELLVVKCWFYSCLEAIIRVFQM